MPFMMNVWRSVLDCCVVDLLRFNHHGELSHHSSQHLRKSEIEPQLLSQHLAAKLKAAAVISRPRPTLGDITKYTKTTISPPSPEKALTTENTIPQRAIFVLCRLLCSVLRYPCIIQHHSPSLDFALLSLWRSGFRAAAACASFHDGFHVYI